MRVLRTNISHLTIYALFALCLVLHAENLLADDASDSSAQIDARDEIVGLGQLSYPQPETKLVQVEFLGCAPDPYPTIFGRYKDGSITRFVLADIIPDMLGAEDEFQAGAAGVCMVTDDLLCDGRQFMVEKDYSDQPTEGVYAWVWVGSQLLQERLVAKQVALAGGPQWEHHPYQGYLQAETKAFIDAYKAGLPIQALGDPPMNRVVFSKPYVESDEQTWPCLISKSDHASHKHGGTALAIEVVNRGHRPIGSVWIKADVFDHFGQLLLQIQGHTESIGSLKSGMVRLEIPRAVMQNGYTNSLEWSVDER